MGLYFADSSGAPSRGHASIVSHALSKFRKQWLQRKREARQNKEIN